MFMREPVDNGASLTIGQPVGGAAIKFSTARRPDALVLDQHGRFLVDGVEVANNHGVYVAFVAWLIEACLNPVLNADDGRIDAPVDQMTLEDRAHVDEFVEEIIHNPSATDAERYAAFWLYHARFDAAHRIAFHDFVKDYDLYCTYRGTRYKVTGASRMGWIHLSRDFTRLAWHGYELSAQPRDCSNWSRYSADQHG